MKVKQVDTARSFWCQTSGFTPKLGEGLAWQRQGLLTNIFARLKSFNWNFYQLMVVILDLRYIIFDSNYKSTIKKVYLCMMYL